MVFNSGKIRSFVYNWTVGFFSSPVPPPNITIQKLRDFIESLQGPVNRYKLIKNDPGFEFVFEESVKSFQNLGHWLKDNGKKPIQNIEDLVETFETMQTILNEGGEFIEGYDIDQYCENANQASQNVIIAFEPFVDDFQSILKNYKSLRNIFERLNLKELNALRDIFLEFSEELPTASKYDLTTKIRKKTKALSNFLEKIIVKKKDLQ